LQIGNPLELQTFEFIFSITDVSVSQDILGLFFSVESFLTFKLSFSLIQSLLVSVELIHQCSKLFSDLVDVIISSCNSFGNFLPFSEQNVSLVMLFLELLGSLVELNLTGLCGCDFSFQLLLFS
jgi:hypothetical protein